jgi:N-acetylglutamate synthase-like GNAT family acetyltransferase
MDIRPYRPADLPACLAVLDSHLPEAGLRAEFEAFLTAPEGPYFVLEHDGALIGCGGYVVQASAARLVWGVIRRDAQHQGLGRFLLMYRLREIGKETGIETVSVEVPAEAAGFFEAQGFRRAADRGGQLTLVKRLIVCS